VGRSTFAIVCTSDGYNTSGKIKSTSSRLATRFQGWICTRVMRRARVTRLRLEINLGLFERLLRRQNTSGGYKAIGKIKSTSSRLATRFETEDPRCRFSALSLKRNPGP
jgi:hypothetical protein